MAVRDFAGPQGERPSSARFTDEGPPTFRGVRRPRYAGARSRTSAALTARVLKAALA
jgi:hypothetical protein